MTEPIVEEWRCVTSGARERHFFLDDRETVQSGYLFGVNPEIFNDEAIEAIKAFVRSRLLTARRPPSHGGDTGSNPVGTTS